MGTMDDSTEPRSSPEESLSVSPDIFVSEPRYPKGLNETTISSEQWNWDDNENNNKEQWNWKLNEWSQEWSGNNNNNIGNTKQWWEGAAADWEWPKSWGA